MGRNARSRLTANVRIKPFTMEVNMNRSLLLTTIAVTIALGAAGCGEREQSVVYKDGRYRGKPDTRPWDKVPAHSNAGGWTKGDLASWKDQLRSRSINSQNENRRIEL